MSFSAYPDYKYSGVEWVNELPAHWRTGALKWMSSIYAGGTPDKNKTYYWDNGSIPWLNSGAVNQVLVSEPSSYITAEAFNSSSARWIPSGSLVIALAGQGKTKGMVAQLAIATTCNQSMAAIVPDLSMVSRYLFWWLSSNYQNIRNMAGGDLRDGLNLEMIGNISAPLPTEAEQIQIARFLDHEIARIDALIEEQRRLIELLMEKRQAVISQAVTKGIDPSVPMKDSGVEWLGEVPAHWCVTKLGWVLNELTYGFTNPMPTEDWGPAMLTANDIGWGVVLYDQARSTSEIAFKEMLTDKSRPRAGDILLTKDGTLGRVAVHDGRAACINQSVALLRPDYRYLGSEFLCSVIQASCYQAKMIFDAGGTAIKHIYITILAKMNVAIPSLDEQQALLHYVNAEIGRFDRLTSEAEQVVALFQERRSALITAAVTGKIDVRGWEPASHAQASELAQEAM